jgi:dipeptidyl-peptidase-4
MSAALLAAGRPHQVLPLSGSTHTPTDPTTVTQLLLHQLEFLAQTLHPVPNPADSGHRPEPGLAAQPPHEGPS